MAAAVAVAVAAAQMVAVEVAAAMVLMPMAALDRLEPQTLAVVAVPAEIP
jgi:hypothetical protein